MRCLARMFYKTCEFSETGAVTQRTIKGYQIATLFLYFFDTGHPCYNQLTPVKTRYLLTGITWPYRGLKSTAHRGHVLFWSWSLTKCWFSIGSRAHVRLICWKQGRNVRKPVTASPGLKVIRIITFFFYTNVFFCCLILCIWWIESQTIGGLHRK